jgi:hypothetical protein
MSKNFDPLDPLSHMKHEAKLKQVEQKQLTTQQRIEEILQGEQPTDVMSWEFFIWKKYKDPLNRS